MGSDAPARRGPEPTVEVLDDGLGEVRGGAALVTFLAAIAGTSLTVIAWLAAPSLLALGIAIDLVAVLAGVVFFCERWVEIRPSGPVLVTRIGPVLFSQRVRRLLPVEERVVVEIARPLGETVTLARSEAERVALARFDYRGGPTEAAADARVHVSLWRPR